MTAEKVKEMLTVLGLAMRAGVSEAEADYDELSLAFAAWNAEQSVENWSRVENRAYHAMRWVAEVD